VRTYSNALTQYRNQVIDFKPLKAKPEDTDVIVRTEVRQAGAKPVQIDYALDKQGDSWKVYDVMVAGVSLVTNYRDSFGQEVRAGGIDGLIKSSRTRTSSSKPPSGQEMIRLEGQRLASPGRSPSPPSRR
jgi:phospholipid transport system substrate-binding protein